MASKPCDSRGQRAIRDTGSELASFNRSVTTISDFAEPRLTIEIHVVKPPAHILTKDSRSGLAPRLPLRRRPLTGSRRAHRRRVDPIGLEPRQLRRVVTRRRRRRNPDPDLVLDDDVYIKITNLHGASWNEIIALIHPPAVLSESEHNGLHEPFLLLGNRLKPGSRTQRFGRPRRLSNDSGRRIRCASMMSPAGTGHF